MITLNVTPLQYDIIKAAVAQYNGNLMQAIEPQHPVEPPPVVLAVRKPKVDAPWGYKKDGTPKSRPGRKAA